MDSELADQKPEPNQRARIFRRIGRGITLFRHFVLNVIFLVALLTVLIFIFSEDEAITVPDEAVLVLNPAGVLVEQLEYTDPVIDFLLGSGTPLETSINELLKTIEYAATDDRVKLLMLDFSRLFNVDFAQVERIQNALLDFKESGKPIWSHGSSYSQGTYILSLIADRVLMDPLGSLILSGVTSSTSYYKDLLTKLNVDIDVFAEGQYKSAIEPYTRSGMSEPTRMVQTNLVQALWQRTRDRIVEFRGIDPERFDAFSTNLHNIVDDSNAGLAQIAIDYGLIDALISKSELSIEYDELLGKSHKTIKFYDYLPFAKQSENAQGDKIAVVVVEGDIFSIDSQLTGQQGGWVRQIRQVRNDKSYSGLVLRVNSPGGSVFESEDIRRELIRYKSTDRPLVASMGGSAASGGYWISAPADYIFATPVTLTGSIGVFGLFPNFADALDNIGISNEVIRTTPYGLSNSFTVKPTEEMQSVSKSTINQFYSYFLSIVAEAREMSLAQVAELAQGRVWLGKEALDLNLVDELGEIEAAIAKTAELAGVSSYRVEYIQPSNDSLSPLDTLLTKLRNQALRAIFPKGLTSSQTLQEIKYLQDPLNVYAQCRYCAIEF